MPSTILTFDDGPGPSTAALLDVLRDAGQVATFFVLGPHAQAAHGLLQRMLDEGHRLGNHTWNHQHDGVLGEEALVEGIRATDRLIHGAYAAAGRAPAQDIPVRLPYGVRPGDTRLATLARLGRVHVDWTGLFEDWVKPAPDPRALAARIRAHIDNQHARGQDAVLCLHDSSPRGESREATVEAVRLWLCGERLPAAQETHAWAG